ncbi:MAG: hypothetical protein L3J16_01160 [Anaerolineales bacterium]|nr:hypothetical protein [Anaerolineales bacterium]
MTWKKELQREFEMAQAARDAENQGKLRVCARRAAGVAIREYLTRHGIKPPSQSAYDLLKLLGEMDDTSADVRQAADFLRLRVTEDFRLPLDVDLVAEAKKVCTALLPDWQH